MQVDEPPPVEPGPAPHSSTAGSPKGLVVSGEVRFADDGAPAADVSFVLHHPTGHVVVQADSSGRFRTDAVVSPGVADLHHRPTDAGGAYPLRLRFAPASLSLQGEPGAEATVELSLELPALVLLVRVRHADGRAAASAQVELETRHEVRPEEYSHALMPSSTSEEGLARFALFDLESLRAARLSARLDLQEPDGGVLHLVTPSLELQLPLPRADRKSPIVLVLEPAGSLRVRVRDEEGSAVAGERVWLSEPGGFLGGFADEVLHTDEAGEALFESLAEGTYLVSCVSGPGSSTPKAEVWAGRRTELELAVATHGARLAVAGLVVDAEGAPLAGIQVHADYGPREGAGDTNASATTDAEGRFEFRAAPCDWVAVRSDRDLFGDEFAPPSVEVAFGTTGVVFRRIRTVERQKVGFEVVDAATLERLSGALVMTYRAPNLGEYAFHRADEGLATPLCPLHPGTTFVIDLAGYRRATVSLDELLAQEPVEGLRRVAMDRGLLRMLHVEGFDATEQQAPVAGARVRLGERVLGVTDTSGDLLLDLYTWPEAPFTIEADGYQPATWSPSDSYAELEPAYVWLERE
jgi:hypothetical protein